MYLTDAPGDYKEVNVDLREVKVKLKKGSGWETVPAQQGVYNLLALKNIDTLIATGVLPTGIIEEIRLVLGPNNTIKPNDDSVHPLITPSAEHSGFKIKLHKRIDNDDPANLTIDFDAELSIAESNGEYRLLPVLQLK